MKQGALDFLKRSAFKTSKKTLSEIKRQLVELITNIY